MTFNDNLMETISNSPAMYDKSCLEYRDKQAKANAWDHIAINDMQLVSLTLYVS